MAAKERDIGVTGGPSFEDVFAGMSAASVGNTTARVALSDQPDTEDLATRFAVALNLLLDDLAMRSAELKAELETRLRTEEQLRQSQKMESIGRLAGGIAHDFNNILTVILGNSEMVAAGLKPGDRIGAGIESIRSAGERAASLTRQLLAFSRQQVLEPKIVDLNQIVTGMDGMLRRLIGEDVELVTRPARQLHMVKVDPGQMEQVLMNLAVNARDAMPRGGKITIETGHVELDDAYARQHVSVTPGPYVMLAVSDTGVGMDKATLARIFEPFFTTKEKGKGTGLGLSTVFGIVN